MAVVRDARSARARGKSHLSSASAVIFVLTCVLCQTSTTIQVNVVSYNERLREEQPDDPYDYQCFEFASVSRMRRLQVCVEYGIRRAREYRDAVEETVLTDAVVQGLHIREP